MALKPAELKSTAAIPPAEAIPAANVPALPRGQKVGTELGLYGGRVLPQTFGEVVEFAQMMCKGGVAIPAHLRDNPGACLSVIQRSMAWEMDPWAVATKTYSVNDVLAYEAQLIAAVVKKWAPVKERVINPIYTGEGETRQCTITLHHEETGEEIQYVSPMIGKDLGKVADDGSKTKSPPSDYKGIWPKNSPLWRHEPDQQLFYYSIRAMARRFFPDILLGVYDREEAYAMRDITPKAERKVQNSLIDEDEPAQVMTGEVMEPEKKPAKVEQEQTMADAYDEQAEDDPNVDDAGNLPPAEVEETVITPDLIAENLIKGIAGSFDLGALEAWQKDNLLTINGLPKELAKKVRKAYSEKYIDLDGGL